MPSPLLNSAGQQLYVLRRISDGFIFNSRAISNVLEGLPNAGPGNQYLPIIKDDIPAYDPVYTTTEETEGADFDPPSSATQWLIEIKVKDRPLSERLAIAENTKRFEITKQIPPQDVTELMVTTLAAVLVQAKGLLLTVDQQAKADRLVLLATAIAENQARHADNVIAITADQKPDLKTGWAPLVP